HRVTLEHFWMDEINQDRLLVGRFHDVMITQNRPYERFCK
ncbi:MAG: hypothetical protein UY76_C0052G0001, partial [Candidatus Uhrbacteria bacterium GW2011_GWA2_52_8d]